MKNEKLHATTHTKLIIVLLLVLGHVTSVVALIPCLSEWPQCLCTKTWAECNGKHFDRNLTYIPRLDWDESITEFIFKNNYLPRLNNNVFENISQYKLAQLNIESNEIQHIQSGAFTKLKYLLSLKIGNNPIVLPELARAFPSLPNGLAYIYLTGLKIGDRDLKGSFLDGLRSKNVIGLHLEHNEIKSFNFSNFHGFGTLSTLSLERNLIRSTNVSLGFSDSLRNLWLSDNQLTRVPQFCDLFRRSFFPNLNTLSLQYNEIYYTVAANFRCLKALTRLFLSGNKIKNVTRFSFKKLPNLQVLTISHNKIPLHVGHWVFRNPQLKSVQLAFSKVSLNKNAFYGSSIEEIVLSGNDFGTKTQEYFDTLLRFGLNGIQTLKCEDCNLTKIPQVVSKMTKLEYLNLAYNTITEIPDHLFDSNRNLRVLLLKNNSIQRMSTFAISPSIRSDLSHADLANNPFFCDCVILWFKLWLLEKRDMFVRHYSNYTCSNHPFKGESIVDVSSISEDVCMNTGDSEVQRYVIGAVVVVLAVCLFVSGYRVRWRFQYCCFVSKRTRWQATMPLLQNNAYVCYNDADIEWVQREVIRQLEITRKLRLCFRQRDFDPTKPTVWNIVQHLQNSTGVLVVMSKAFLKDRKSQVELSVLERQLQACEINIIVVLLEDVEGKFKLDAFPANRATCFQINGQASSGVWDDIASLLTNADVTEGNLQELE